ncbi:HK97 gp10 family phage protein [Streptomyces scopuliridis]|uniref:HK97 gp10 family phage protein n=1 Tax=Streptomyces scopuliridis TaxID=452529 RepID=UPI0034439F4E
MTPDELADRLDQAADRLGPAIERRVQHAAEIGRGLIRSNASGRPGPNIITGQYWASWQTRTRAIPYGAQCTIGTDRPQGRRLEFGFFDMTDSLGRHYYQPPFPHVGPAISAIEAALLQGMRDAATEVFS